MKIAQWGILIAMLAGLGVNLSAQKGDDMVPIAGYGFREGLSPFYDFKLDKWGYVDKAGKTVIPATYNSVQPFDSGIAVVTLYDQKKDANNSWLIDKTGKRILSLDQFTNYDLPYFSEGLAQLRSGEGPAATTQFIDRTGKVVLTTKLADVGIFSGGLASFRQPGTDVDLYGFIDTKGKVAIKPAYMEVGNFSDGLAWVCVWESKSDKRDAFYIDKNGAKTGYAERFSANEGAANGGETDYSDGLLRRSFTDEKDVYTQTFIDKKGKVVFTVTKEDYYLSDFHEGLALVATDSLYGYVGKDGKEVIKPQFEFAGDFSEGLAPILVKNRVGFIDPKGKVIIKPQFSTVFSDEEAGTINPKTSKPD